MGCDGGTIPRRDELVRTRQKPEQKDKVSERAFKWKHCVLSQAALEKPIVTCELGNLYSKASVLEALLNKDGRPAAIAHLRGLKDIRPLNLTETVGATGRAPTKADGYVDTQAAQYMCPVVGLEMNGRHKFVALWRCGCVLSERAVRMVRGEQCPHCSAPMQQLDMIALNPDADQLPRLVENMEQRREQAKQAKKAAKSKLPSVEAQGDEPQPKKAKSKSKTAAASAKPATSLSINLPNDGKLVDPAFANTSTAYSIAKDGEKTEVYKSLFTSHQNAINQPKGHWVTYNPLFN